MLGTRCLNGAATQNTYIYKAIINHFLALTHDHFVAAVSSRAQLCSLLFSIFPLGELAAFVIGWNLLLEYIIGKLMNESFSY